MKQILLRGLLRIIALLLYCSPSTALDYTAEADFFGESPVVLTVSRMHKPLRRSPASVSVIDREMIRNSGARDIAGLLRMAPGMITGYFVGHTPVVTYQGQGHEFHRQLQVLIDGRSVFVPSFGGVPWTSLPLLIEDIERIEITRGPNAVTYGSNAFLATVNIITRHAAEDAGGMISLTQQMDSRSDINDVYLRYGDQIDDLDWRISAGRESDNGYALRNDPRSSEKFNLRTDFLTAPNRFWTIQAGINRSRLGQGTGDPDEPVRDAINSNSYQYLKWEQIDRDVETTVKLTHTRDDYDDAFELTDFVISASVPAIRAPISFSRLSERSDLEIYQNRRFSDSLSLNYGLGIRLDEVKSVYLFSDSNRHELETRNLFAGVEWIPRSGTTLDVGFLSEDTDRAERQNSFRFSAIQTLGNHHFRFVSSSAKRNPVLWEEDGEISFSVEFQQALPPALDPFLQQPFKLETSWLNSRGIQPESILSNEIGLFSEFLERQLTTDLKLFRYRISNQVTDQDVALQPPLQLFDGPNAPLLIAALGLDPEDNILDDQTSTIINGGRTTVDGIEYSFNYSPRRRSYRLYGGLSRVRVNSFEQNTIDSYPDLSAFLGGHIDPAQDHQLSATLYYVDRMSWIDRSAQIDAFTKMDIRYQYTIDQKKDVNLELIGYDVLENYDDYRFGNVHKPAYVLTLSGRF